MENWTQVCIPLPSAKGVEVALQKVGHFVTEHRLLSSAALLLWSYYPDVPFVTVYNVFYATPRAIFRWILGCFGFTEDGIARNSWASQYQSIEYGGYIPRDSLFASYQSFGASDFEWEEESPGWFLSIVRWSACIAAVYVLFK